MMQYYKENSDIIFKAIKSKNTCLIALVFSLLEIFVELTFYFVHYKNLQIYF